ncbi:MAG: transglutaminase domain-containing protein [Eubacteriales bacterium]|nr:transglutaminase domain-containing protein [Eubacteriales bacterium]
MRRFWTDFFIGTFLLIFALVYSIKTIPASGGFDIEYSSYYLFDGERAEEYGIAKGTGYYDSRYYQQLTPNEQAIYDMTLNWTYNDEYIPLKLPNQVLFYSADKKPTDFELSGVRKFISNSYQRAIDALLMDNPQIFYLKMGDGGCVCNYEYRILSDDKECLWVIDSLKLKLVVKDCYKGSVKEAVARLNKSCDFIPPGDTNYQKIKSIYNYIIKRGEYKEGENSDDAYGLLVEGEGVCSGFAKAFKLLCDKNNIPSTLVTGTGFTRKESGEHIWGLVQMEDGLWYGVDPTWDDNGAGEYFLVGGETISSSSKYSFEQSHIPLGDFSSCGYKQFLYPAISDKKYYK